MCITCSLINDGNDINDRPSRNVQNVQCIKHFIFVCFFMILLHLSRYKQCYCVIGYMHESIKC